MRLLQKKFWPRRFLLLALLWQLLSLLLNGCGTPAGLPACEANPGPSPVPALMALGNSIYLMSRGTRSLLALRANDGALEWKDVLLGTSLTGEDEKLVYLDNSSYPYRLVVLRANDGKVLWSRSTNEAPVIQDNSVYVYQDGMLTALDDANGFPRWTTKLASFTSSLQVVDGVVYLLDGQGEVHAFDATTGVQIWQASLDQVTISSGGGEPAYDQPPYTHLQVFHGVVYVRTDEIYALRASDGKLLWKFSSADHLPHAFEVANGVVYFMLNGHIAALQARDGKLLWQSQGKTGYWFFLLTPDVLYAVVEDPSVSWIETSDLDAFQISNGKLLWHSPTPQSLSYIRALISQGSVLYLLLSSQPSLHDSNATLLALQNTTRKLLWKHSVDAAALLIAGRSLYAGLAGNSSSPCAPRGADQLTAFDALNGTLLWHKQFQGV